MSEEEIIKNIKEMIQWSDHNTYKIALQGILDLYEQEKARNKDLEQIEKEHKEENGRLRDRIKELEETLKCTQKSWFEDTKKIEIYKMLEANIAKANEIIKNGIPKSLVREKMNKDIKTHEHTILGGRRHGKTLEYGIRLGRIQMCEELLEERK